MVEVDSLTTTRELQENISEPLDVDLDWTTANLNMAGAILVCRNGLGRIVVDHSLTHVQRAQALRALQQHFPSTRSKPQALALWCTPTPDDAD